MSPGVAGPLSCWWRWDPVHVYLVARLAPSLVHPSAPNRSPRAVGRRLLCAPSPSPPTFPPLPCPWLAWTAERRAVPSIHSLGTETGLAAVGCCPLPGP